MTGRYRTLLSLVLALTVVVGATGCDQLRVRMALKSGNTLFNAQRFEEAVQEYEKIRRIDPNNWVATYQIAMSYMALYHPQSMHPKDVEYAQKAIVNLEKLLELNAPDDETKQKVRDRYISMLINSDQVDKAIKYYEDFLKTDTRNTQMMLQLAGLYFDKKGNIPDTLRWYAKIAEIEPKNKEIYYRIGATCWARSYYGHKNNLISIDERGLMIEKGIEAQEKALALDPDYFEALNSINLLYREKADRLKDLEDLAAANQAYEKAEEWRKKAVEARQKQKAAEGK